MTRPYLIRRIGEAGKPRLVDAANPSAALRHVAQATFSVKAATGAEVAEAMRQGVPLEVAGEEAAPAAPAAPPAAPQAPATAAAAPTPAPVAPIVAPDAAAAAAAALDTALDTPELVLTPPADEPESDEAPAPGDGWLRDNGRVLEAILIIDEDWTGFGTDDAANLRAIASWSDAEARAVEEFCAAVSANPDTIPVRPDVIGGPLPGQVPARPVDDL